MIIPLYNLQAHNIMTNVIVDAGTDAKVARFAKRGLEILGLSSNLSKSGALFHCQVLYRQAAARALALMIPNEN
jgi:hypothetical protein